MAQRISPIRLARISRGITLHDATTDNLLRGRVSEAQLSRIERGLAKADEDLLQRLQLIYERHDAIFAPERAP